MITRTPLPQPLFLPPRIGLSVVGLALAALIPAVMAASSNTKKVDGQDSGPVLMSRTGGGGWSNMKQLEEAVAKGNPAAEAQLGEYLLRGEGVAQDTSRAIALLEKAAQAGNAKAAFRLGMTFTNGEFGVPAEAAKGLAYFRAAAAGGESEGFFNVGAAYANGKGVKRDYGEALGWLIVARERGAGASAETDLRERIKSAPQWIARGERRAREIQAEFADRKMQDFLPGAKPAEAQPAGAGDSLKPATPPLEVLKPSLPVLPSPQFK